MKSVKLNDHAALVRHWWRWYIVSRHGMRWEPLGIVHARQRKPRDPLTSNLSRRDAVDKLEKMC